MIHKEYKTITKTEEIITHITCNKCGKVGQGKDYFELNGDETRVTWWETYENDTRCFYVHLCKECLFSVIKSLNLEWKEY